MTTIYDPATGLPMESSATVDTMARDARRKKMLDDLNPFTHPYTPRNLPAGPATVYEPPVLARIPLPKPVEMLDPAEDMEVVDFTAAIRAQTAATMLMVEAGFILLEDEAQKRLAAAMDEAIAEHAALTALPIPGPITAADLERLVDEQLKEEPEPATEKVLPRHAAEPEDDGADEYLGGDTWTPQVADLIVSLYVRQRLSVDDIASRHGMRPDLVRAILRESRVPLMRRNRTPIPPRHVGRRAS